MSTYDFCSAMLRVGDIKYEDNRYGGAVKIPIICLALVRPKY